MRRARFLSVVVLFACGGGESQAPPPKPVAAPAVVDASAPPPAPASTVSGADPNALAQLLAAAAAAAVTPMQPASASGGGDEAENGLRDAAAKYAAGMTPAGEIAKGTLTEGGHLGFIANLEPGKCYTIVAYGAGLEDLDLFLLVPPFYNLLGAHDVSTGPVAIIGGAPKMCPISPIAVPYKIDMHAKKGGGPVAARVFSKPK